MVVLARCSRNDLKSFSCLLVVLARCSRNDLKSFSCLLVVLARCSRNDEVILLFVGCFS